jgi:hypothetical protein
MNIAFKWRDPDFHSTIRDMSRFRSRLPFALALLLAGLALFIYDRWPPIPPIEDGPAAKYEKEFREWEKELSSSVGRGNEYEAPDGSAKIVDKILYWDCYSFWVESKSGERRKIVRMGAITSSRRLIPPANHVWSRDNRAIFFKGYQHPGQCGTSPGGRVRLVHIVADGGNWRMPKEDVDLYNLWEK